MYALQIKNRSESDPHSCEETQATAKTKPGKHSELLIGFQATTSAIPGNALPNELYEALLEALVKSEFYLFPLYEESSK